jgi:uncharacterized iron-regulated membrane protein
MKHRLRAIIFWIHLGTGLLAGLVVALMGGTGAVMAFEPQIMEWVDRGTRHIEVPDPAPPRRPLDDLLASVRAAAPKTPPVAVVVQADPGSAVRVATGRRDGFHVDPYTGQARAFEGSGWRTLFQTMIEWHRYLGMTTENRAIGRAITGAANAAFLFLALSGLYLWWPRRWRGRALRLSLWYRRRLSGRARDFNWHNVTGFWSLPIIIVLTASGMMISYPWFSNLISRATGQPIPTVRGPAAAPPVPVPAPPPGARPLPLERMFAAAVTEVPRYKTITYRMPAPAPGGARKPQAVVLSVKPAEAWPLFATVTVSLDPFTGEVLRREGFSDAKPDRKVRLWLRFLHTGEALGWAGQLLAGLASLGATLLVWTGMALAWRRFFPKKRGVVEVADALTSDPPLKRAGADRG